MKKVMLVSADHPLIYSLKQIASRCRKVELTTVVPDAYKVAQSASQLSPDVVIIDAVTSQLDITRQVKKSSPTSNILVLASEADLASALEAFASGANGYLLRSVPIESIVPAIEAVAAGKVVTEPEIAASFARRYSVSSLTERVNRQCLTARELQVLQLIADGYKDKQIASALGVSLRTVKTHVTSIMTKLGAQSRIQAVLKATRQGLLPE